MKQETIYRFVEPHFTGGHSTIDITEEQIIKYMTERYSRLNLDSFDHNELIADFVAENWAWKVEE
jgi:hypothetical protein